ncbi:DNA cytosine methyltransferase [Phycicoccus sp. CSK15P-2]|uniref:DNA cytosine methyltransferase n=1 Tax=Phycicoccus sp. CSK15P-2 TaxID=2807627 RepID=UPI00194FD2BF|nr:DNA cytosine methyltransferase [Phycicoccus sp. CSK15P-2]MBM6403525.1 DNA cytosine methyltransferase [Phycicoccus sp. CSK15P-2]
MAELFAGVGSVAEGFRRGAGFDVAYLNDVDPAARDTYQENYGKDVPYDLIDVQGVTADRIREKVDGKPIAGLLGCPPCQGWSTAGPRREGDVRNALLGDFFRLITDLRPMFFVMENVPAVSDRVELSRALQELSPHYRTWVGVLNAASFGLPQSRQRTLVIGYDVRTGVQPLPPAPTHAGVRRVWDYRSEQLVKPSADTIDTILGAAPRLGSTVSSAYSMAAHYRGGVEPLKNFVTVGEALRDLDPESGQKPSDYVRGLGGGWLPPENHRPWGHGPDLVARLSKVAEGGRPSSDVTAGKRYYSQAYARLHRRGLARTITTNFHNPGSGRFLHYSQPRSLTVREAARLQGFRDDFRFIHHPSWQERLVGNAFPPLWAEVIARHVGQQLGESLALSDF